MKNIFKYVLMAASALFGASACVEEEAFNPGEQDLDGCYGVYFPVQEASGSHTFDPSMATEMTIKVARRNTDGAITVPVDLRVSHQGIFEVEDIKFEDGQGESEFKVTFPTSENNIEYRFGLTISDPMYASRYLEGALDFDFSVLRVEWKDLMNPTTQQPAVVTFYQGWWGEVHTASVKYYEVNGIRHCVATCLDKTEEDGQTMGMWGDVNDKVTFNFIWNTKVVNPDNYQVVDVKKQYFGFDFTDGEGPSSQSESQATNPIYVYDHFHYLTTDGPYPGGWPNWQKFLEMNPGAFAQSYYDGNGGFYFNLTYQVPTLGGGFRADEFDVVAIVDGYTRVDYSISAETALTHEGKVPVGFDVGTDVQKIRFKVYKGRLNPAEVKRYSEALLAGTAEDVQEIAAVHDNPETEDEEFTFAQITLPESGIYTLLAVSIDKEGKTQEVAEPVEFTYVASGDEQEKATVINVGLELTNSLANQGIDKTNSIQYFIYGKDLTEVRYSFFKTSDVEKYGIDACVATLLAKGKPVSAEVLEQINTATLVDMETKLSPVTSYTIVVYATNGYTEKAVSAEIETEGLPMEYLGKPYFESEFYAMFGLGNKEIDVAHDPNIKDKYTLNIGGLFNCTLDKTNKTANVPVQLTFDISAAVQMPNSILVVAEAKEVIKPDTPGYDALEGSHYTENKDMLLLEMAYLVFDSSKGQIIGSVGAGLNKLYASGSSVRMSSAAVVDFSKVDTNVKVSKEFERKVAALVSQRNAVVYSAKPVEVKLVSSGMSSRKAGKSTTGLEIFKERLNLK